MVGLPGLRAGQLPLHGPQVEIIQARSAPVERVGEGRERAVEVAGEVRIPVALGEHQSELGPHIVRHGILLAPVPGPQARVLSDDQRVVQGELGAERVRVGQPRDEDEEQHRHGEEPARHRLPVGRRGRRGGGWRQGRGGRDRGHGDGAVWVKSGQKERCRAARQHFSFAFAIATGLRPMTGGQVPARHAKRLGNRAATAHKANP